MITLSGLFFCTLYLFLSSLPAFQFLKFNWFLTSIVWGGRNHFVKPFSIVLKTILPFSESGHKELESNRNPFKFVQQKIPLYRLFPLPSLWGVSTIAIHLLSLIGRLQNCSQSGARLEPIGSPNRIFMRLRVTFPTNR